jgi:hypothetical protein
MLTLLLDPRFKSLCLVSSFIDHDQVITIVEQHDTMSLYPMVMKCYYNLHPLTIVSIKLTKELVKRKLLVF